MNRKLKSALISNALQATLSTKVTKITNLNTETTGPNRETDLILQTALGARMNRAASGATSKLNVT